MILLRLVRRLCLFLAVLGATAPAHSEIVKNFYQGKTIDFILATGGPGGGYGLYGQLIAKYLPKYWPGHPKVVIRYMPGGGGIAAANYMYSIASRDGTAMALLSNDAPQFEVLDGRGVKYNASEFQYIGRAASMQYVVVVWHTAGVRKLSDMKTHQIVFGTTGPSQSSYTIPVILKRMFHLKSKIILGYPSTSQIDIALENGEITGRAAAWSSLFAQHLDWFKNGTVIPIVQSGIQRSAGLQNVPLLTEFAKSDEQKSILNVFSSDAVVGRAVNFPPGTPKDRVVAARKAFSEAMTDPQLLQDAKREHVPIEPWSGEKLQKYVDGVISTPATTIAKARAMLQASGNSQKTLNR